MSAQGSISAPSLPDFFTLIALDAVGSTNDEVRSRAENNAPAGTLVWATEQLTGRGRRGREWNSPPGNLYCSVLLRPDASPAVAAQLSFVTALALGEGLHEHLPISATLQYKWPNDVLINGSKISGILLESQVGEGGKLDWVVIGTGVNIESFPEHTERPATCLREIGTGIGVADVLGIYTGALAFWLARWEEAGFQPIRDAWLRRAIGLGEPIEVRLPNDTMTGTFDALDETGALILLTSHGRRVIAAGEVYVRG